MFGLACKYLRGAIVARALNFAMEPLRTFLTLHSWIEMKGCKTLLLVPKFEEINEARSQDRVNAPHMSTVCAICIQAMGTVGDIF